MPVFIEINPNCVEPVNELGFKEDRENELENLIINNPKIFPVEKISGNVQWIPISKQMTLLDGRLRTDTIGVDDEGVIYVIENKLDSNDDKKRVSQQVRDYAHVLRTMKWDDFLMKINQANKSNGIREQKFNFSGKSLEEVLENTKDLENNLWSKEKAKECFENIQTNFEIGKFILVISINKISKPLRISIDGENEVTDENVMSMFALEVNDFITHKGEKIIVTNTYPYDLTELRERKQHQRTKQNEKEFNKQLLKMDFTDTEKKFISDYYEELKQLVEHNFEFGTSKIAKILPRFLINDTLKSPISLDAAGKLNLQFESLHKEDEAKILDEFIEELKQIEFIRNKMTESSNIKRTTIRIQLKDWKPFASEIISILEKVFKKN